MKILKFAGIILLLLIVAFALRLQFKSSIPRGVKTIENFELNKYLGKWYEIARIDFKYEKDMNNTTAEYSMNENGTVRVQNRGYNYKTNKWSESIGKAKFVGKENVGMLKVSFFGPFYAGYNVLALDPDYKYALVGGESHDFLWILCRETSIPDSIKTEYLKIAQDYGYHTKDLIWVEHK